MRRDGQLPPLDPETATNEEFNEIVACLIGEEKAKRVQKESGNAALPLPAGG